MVSHKCCSGYCKKFEECSSTGILRWMKILPIHPEDKPNKDWCHDFDPEQKLNKTYDHKR